LREVLAGEVVLKPFHRPAVVKNFALPGAIMRQRQSGDEQMTKAEGPQSVKELFQNLRRKRCGINSREGTRKPCEHFEVHGRVADYTSIQA